MRIPKHYAAVERGSMPDDSFGEAEVIEVARPDIHATIESHPIRIRIDDVPQPTIVTSPDEAAAAAAAMLSLSNSERGNVGFRVEYPA